MHKLSLIITLLVFSSFTGTGDDTMYNSKFLGKKLKETPFGEYVKQDLPGKTMVMFVSYGCSHCWDATKAIEELKKRKMIDNIIILGNGTEADKEEFKKNTLPDYTMIDYDMGKIKINILASDPEFPSPPCALFIKDNILEKVFTKMPNPKTFTFLNLNH